MSVRFGVDLDVLATAIDQLTRFQQRLADRLDQLDATVAEVHLTWTGAAATAQRSAHEQWARGARQVHQGLAEMTAAAQVAQDDYAAAAEANAAMWAGLS